MLAEWLFRTTLELSLLIGLVLLIRPFVRRTLGAGVAYWLWFIPLIRAVLPDRPARPQLFIESLGPATGGFDVYPLPATWTVSDAIPWASIWVVGMALWLLFKLFAWIRFRAALAAGTTPLGDFEAVSCSTAGPVKPGRVRFVATDLPGAPFVTGLLEPRVCLPRDFTERFSSEERAWVIRHELMHVARGDLWVQLAFELLRAAFWFNPVVHIAARAVRDDQELACDQAIVSGCDADARYSYGKTLIASSGGVSPPISVPFFGKHKERIAMIARHKASGIRNGVGVALCAALGACALTSADTLPELAIQNSGKPITFSFVDLELNSIVRLMADFSATNIVISDQVPNVKVTMRAQDVPWDEALQKLVGCVGAEIIPYSNDVIAIRPRADGQRADSCGDVGVSDQEI